MIAKSTVILPELPFENRGKESAFLKHFISSGESFKALLIEGEAGVGKSRLLSNVISTLGQDITPVLINVEDEKTGGNSIIKQLEKQALYSSVSQKDHRKHISLFLRRTPENFVEIIPKLAKSAPILGHAAEESLNKALKINQKENLDFKKNRLIKDLLQTLFHKAENRVCFLIDGFEKLSEEGIKTVSPILSATREFKKESVRFVFLSRKISQDIPLLKFISNLSNSGELIRYELCPLSDHCVKSIASKIFENPEKSSNIIKLTDGVPQKLLDILIRLNLNGNLESQDEKISLPSNIDTVSCVVSEIWELLESRNDLRRLLGVLAVTISPFPISMTNSLLKVLTRDLDLDDLLLELIDFGILGVQSDGDFPDTIVFRHDTIRHQIISQLSNKSKFEYIRYSEYSFQMLKDYLSSRKNNTVEILMSGSSGNYEYLDLNDYDLGVFIKMAKNSWDSNLEDAESISLNAIKICIKKENFSSVIEIGTELLNEILKKYSYDSIIVKNLLISMAKAYYALGNFKKCIELSLKIKDPTPEISYLCAVSKSIDKTDNTTLDYVEKAIERHKKKSSTFIPLLYSVEALSYQESGMFSKGLSTYTKYLNLQSNTNKKDWGLFNIMSPLFVSASTAIELIDEAISQFRSKSQERFLGIALHNKGYAYMRLNRYDDAKEKFEQASKILTKCAPQETLFPENNLAFISLLENDYAAAKDRITSCLFRPLPAHYKGSILHNLSIARWEHENYLDAMKTIEQISFPPGLQVHSWFLWKIQWTKCLFNIMTNPDLIDEPKIEEYYKQFSDMKMNATIAPYWNRLMKNTAGKFSFSIPVMQTSGADAGPVTEVANPDKSLILPSAFCFGHI